MVSLKEDLAKQRKAADREVALIKKRDAELTVRIRADIKRLNPLVRSVLDEVGTGTWGRSLGLFRRYFVAFADSFDLQHARPRWSDEDERKSLMYFESVIWEVDRLPKREARRTVGLCIYEDGWTSLWIDGHIGVRVTDAPVDELRKALEDAFRPR